MLSTFIKKNLPKWFKKEDKVSFYISFSTPRLSPFNDKLISTNCLYHQINTHQSASLLPLSYTLYTTHYISFTHTLHLSLLPIL